MGFKLSIVIPVYNSSAILPELTRRIDSFLLRNAFADKFELIFVNDSSRDSSWNVIISLASEYKYVKGICLRANFGQHNAIMAGLKASTGDIVILMDDDLQHPPEEIGRMVDIIRQGADVCYISYLNRKHDRWKIIGSNLNDWVVTKLIGKPKGIYLSSFKAIRQSVVKEIIKYEGPYTYIDGIIINITVAIKSIDIEHHARHSGKGNYTPLKSFALFLNMVTSFSIVPLRIAIISGFFMTVVGGLLSVIIVVNKLLHPEIASGWTSLFATILFLGGVQTFCIGMFGEYLGRAYLKISNKPQYVIRETTDQPDKVL